MFALRGRGAMLGQASPLHLSRTGFPPPMVAPFTPEKPTVTADWLKSHLTAPDVRVLDCTWFLPTESKTGKAEYDAHHIPGARFFDIDDISDTASPHPH